MGSGAAKLRMVRFGPFELDLSAEQLRKNGVRLKLQDQPYQVLAALLEKPGVLVTREELKERLWSADTFVDFDRGLNTAINKIREALGDSAHNPRFVETIPKRGYRFVYPLENGQSSLPEAKVAADGGRGAFLPRFLAVAVLGVLVVLAFFVHTWQAAAPPHLEIRRLTSNPSLTTDPALSWDGKLLAYASDRSGEQNLDIWVQPVSGRDPLRLTFNAADDRDPAFSPDNSVVAFRSERDGGGIYTVPALGGEPRLVAPQGWRPRFSPDGRWIAYWTGRPYGDTWIEGSASMFVVPAAEGGAPRQLRPDFGAARYPTWSPDGKQILFAGTKRDVSQPEWDWWITPLDEGPVIGTKAAAAFQRQGLYLPRLPIEPAAWRDAPADVLFSAASGDSFNIWRIPVQNGRAAGDAERVTTGSEIQTQPAAAGDRVAYASLVENLDIWSLAIDTERAKVVGDPQRLTSDISNESSGRILPAKNLLVFAALRSARPDMWVRDLRTNKERVLVANAVPHRVSSDGEWVGYHDLGTTRIFEVPVGGGKPTELCPHCMFWDWSVNRRRIVHVKNPRDVPPAVWLWDVASQEDSVLIRDPEYSIYMPNISPDGHWIAFMAMMGQRGAGIFVAPFQDRPVERRQWLGINESAGLNEDPSWSPSGRVLYFESRRDGSHCVWAQRLDPATKLPVGDPVEVFHSRLQLSLHNPSAVSVSRDQLVMTLVERSGNIWIQELAAAKR